MGKLYEFEMEIVQHNKKNIIKEQKKDKIKRQKGYNI